MSGPSIGGLTHRRTAEAGGRVLLAANLRGKIGRGNRRRRRSHAIGLCSGPSWPRWLDIPLGEPVGVEKGSI